MNYKLKERKVSNQTRFDIYDMNDNVIDDAQGYGYKTAQSAHKAAWYRLKGGNKKVATAQKFWFKNKEFSTQISNFLLDNFKEEISNNDIIEFAKECGIDNFNPKYLMQLKI